MSNEMNILKDIIERCHQRHKKPIKQRKTVPTPAMLSKGYPHQYTVYCAYKHPVLLDDLEQAEISFMPIGRAPDYDRGPRDFGGHRFFKRQGMKEWRTRRWNASWGIQIYTGVPSERNSARWHDIDFKYEAILADPDAVFACIEALVNSVVNPLLVLTKSGGLRFSCRIQDYLHSDTIEEKLYTHKHTPTLKNPYHRDVYLEIFGEKGYSRWDARYEILLGNLLDPPVISKEVLFAPLDALRVKLHEPAPDHIQDQIVTHTPSSLGSQNLDLAKEAFLKRGFIYLRQENGFHHWTQHGGDVSNTEVLLWENEDTVWVRTLTPDAGLPMEATPITDIWNKTGIVPPTLASTLPVSDNMLVVQEGKLSPLAVRRPAPVLHKPEVPQNVYRSSEETAVQLQRPFDKKAHIIGLNVEAGDDTEFHLLNNRVTCLNVPTATLAEAAEQRLQNQNLPSVGRWKPRMHLWDQVKDIPFDVRMANPFQHGNVCEDAERCETLEEKGGDASEIVCPQCPVWTACQERGYLSRPAALQRANTQILESPQLFFDPQHAKVTEEIFETENRVCILNHVQAYDLFPVCRLPKTVMEAWIVNWKGSALGNFANALLNALEIRGNTHSDIVKRVRTVMQTFQWQEKELIQQMCHVNVRGRVIKQGIVDEDTGKELARFTIEFEGGAAAYIPLNENAADRLTAKGLLVFSLRDFVLNEDTRIPMPMAQAIQLGILRPENIQCIQTFPTVCPDPNWTYWHQLKCFFASYTRDADAPIRWWKHKVLRFRVPPVLHPRVKKLVLMSTTLSEQHLRRAFPDDDVEVSRIKPTPWLTGNQVFQIRTGLYPREAILDYGNVWKAIGVSKIGHRIFAGIRAEIEREPNVKHLIVAGWLILNKLEKIIETENVCFLTDTGSTVGVNTDPEGADVIWIIGMPERAIGVIWERSQVLFGNDEKPLCYDRKMDPYHYIDERVQSVYEEAMVRVITEFVGYAQLNRQTGKKVMLLTGLPLPDITDRPETVLFDWEDFEIADGLDRLAEVIETRQRFETERANLTAESGKDKVRQVLGCSERQANRVLVKLRGGTRVTFREQILTLLADGEKKVAEMSAAIDGNPAAIHHELVRLTKLGEIVKVRRGVYALPETSPHKQ